MRPEDKEPFVAAVRQQQRGLSDALFSMGAGVDDALCALPHLVEDAWKGYVAPSQDRDAPGQAPGSYYRDSMKARGSAAADMGQLAFEVTTPGILQRATTGTTSVETARGRKTGDIAGGLLDAVRENPLRTAGAVGTGIVAGKLPVTRAAAGRPAPGGTSARLAPGAPGAPAVAPRAPAATTAPRPAVQAAPLTPVALEMAAKRRALAWEAANNGHSVGRHGPEVSLQALKDRVIKGFAPDGRWSPQRYSGRFNTYRDMMDTYDAAMAKLNKDGVRLDRAPRAGEPHSHDVVLDHGRAIDDGFVAPQGTPKHTVADSPGGTQKAWTAANPVSGVTATFTKVAWNAEKAVWQVVQHFPLVKGWDQATKSYPGGLPQ